MPYIKPGDGQPIKDHLVRGLQDVFDFGKYKMSTVEFVIEEDPKYVVWCLKNVKEFDLNPKADKFLQQCLEEDS